MRAERPSSGELDDLPRGRDAEFIGTPPHAYFESPRNLAATESLQFDAQSNPQAKLFLGVAGGQALAGPRLRDGRVTRLIQGGTPLGLASDQHHVVIAGSRAGKGRSVLLPILLSLPQVSVLCLDPKGELARISARWRAGFQKVGILDPFGVTGSQAERYRVSFNPLEILLRSDRRTFVPNARLIADSLIISSEQKDPHWDDTAKQILSCLCALVATSPRYEGVRDLITVWQLASELASPDPDDPSRFWLERELMESDAGGGMLRRGARQFYDRTGGEFSSVLSNLRKNLDVLGIECMGDCLTGPSIDLRDFIRGSMTLYVAVPAMRMSELAGWQRLIVQLTLAVHEELAAEVDQPTVALLDEFHTLGRLSCLETAAAQFAGLCRLVTVLQDISQLRSRYPQSWETFIGNAGALQVFGLADHATQDYVSQRLGEAPTLSRATNLPGFDQATRQAATGESWSLGVHRLLTAEEVGRYFSRDDPQQRQLVLRPGYRPAVLMRACYDQHELFRGRFDATRR